MVYERRLIMGSKAIYESWNGYFQEQTHKRLLNEVQKNPEHFIDELEECRWKLYKAEQKLELITDIVNSKKSYSSRDILNIIDREF